MFDYHIHTSVSFDSEENATDALAAARSAGLKEICFTDHYDFHFEPDAAHDLFTKESYDEAYANLSLPGISVKRGVEFGLTDWNAPQLRALVRKYDFDFVLGSVHYADGYDPYMKEYWNGKTVEQGFLVYLERVLECVRAHTDFDVLGHINYVCKAPHNPTRSYLFYKDYSEICDEIMRELVKHGKGMEINSSGVDRVGDFLPNADFLRRFRELGGEIVTVGSDAHAKDRIGQYSTEALAILRDIFGYVCTFDKRRPIFHKL